MTTPIWLWVKPGLMELVDGFVSVESVLEHADDDGTLLSFHIKLRSKSRAVAWERRPGNYKFIFNF